jgi:hypothetical protein
MDLPLTARSPGPVPDDWVPVDTCALPTTAQPLRVAEFDALFAAAPTSVERAPGTPTRARLLLAGGESLRERVQRLAEAETACCSFFTFTVTPLVGPAGGPAVALAIEVPAAHADVLAALVARAEQARGVAA